MNNNIDWIIHLVANGACDECGKEEKGFLPYCEPIGFKRIRFEKE